ncbi:MULTISPECIES: ABC transporter permease [Enterobacteriaceae]|uniref:ABC transporter permease n=1 Tax=Enterobacteriaceae TaxID=543 RepID=UPI000CDE171B|nr:MULTISPECIES: ABC transporter permease [Enterobacteriaceae]EJZ8387405.1 ABC transporter permease [Klebsiella oxytoca]MCU2324414.1 ABC transporter permease [Enterobacter hormaechei subsp. steigerwaltii]MCU3341616.1 ABC transporter permease [Enterobacter hormaechei subsp. hoffmannii]MCU3613993.1 ABC transporter permease [Enterobacter hormaechei subsp. oharae]POU76402.1 ABC transporter permease [Leclercia sp. LSNIH7]POU78353.1 ABC transporter permease [Leclercia sp. LSNIH6]POW53098.1 ABC tra
MSREVLFINIIVALILLFVLGCVLFRFRDVKFAFLNLFRHKRRSFSTIAAIVLGGVSIFLYGGFIDYSFWILKEQTIRTNIGHVQIYNQNYFETSNKNKSLIENYTQLKQAILETPELAENISTLSGQLEFTGVISQYENETSSYFSGLGIEALPALKLGSFDKIISGSDLSRIRADEITLGSGLAKTLNTKYDDWLDAMVVNTRGGQGALSLKVRGIFASGIKDYDDVAMKLPLATAQRIMGTDGVSKVLILLKDDDSAAFAAKLRQFIARHQLPLIVKEWKEVSLFYQQVEGLLSGIYFFIKLIVALIVIFMISNAMTMNIIERTREITTLRAIGLKPLRVTRLFFLEGIFVGITGAIGSLTLGLIIASVINLYGIEMPPSPGQTTGYTAFIKTNSPSLIWITLVLPILTATGASILPALRASRLNISDAFKFS